MKMNQEKWMMTSGLCALMAVLVMASGCKDEKADKHAAPDAEAGYEKHGADDGHGHVAEPTAVPSAAMEKRVSEKCEHSIPIYQCDECRYEVGVVKLDASLLKQAGGNGLVRTQSVVRIKALSALPVTGEVVLNGNATVHISPRVAGIVESVPVDIGARVKAGDTLLTLASVELGKAAADYERNRTLSELSGKVLARETKLMEQNVGSGQDVIEAQMAFEQHRTDLKASEQMLHVLGLTEEDMSEMREPQHGAGAGRLSIRAPVTGMIIEKHAVTGEMVEPGKDLMMLSDLTTVWVWADVHSRDLGKLLDAEKRGPVEVEITVNAFPEKRFKGMLDYVGSTMSEQSRTVKVRAAIQNPDMELRPGMFCEAAVFLDNGNAEEVLAVPQGAVFSDEGKDFVFKHWKDDFYVRQDVRKGREFSGMAEIVKGLQAGETVATDGGFLLKSDLLREKMGAGCAD